MAKVTTSNMFADNPMCVERSIVDYNEHPASNLNTKNGLLESMPELSHVCVRTD